MSDVNAQVAGASWAHQSRLARAAQSGPRIGLSQSLSPSTRPRIPETGRLAPRGRARGPRLYPSSAAPVIGGIGYRGAA